MPNPQSNPENGTKMATLTIEAELDGRRVTLADIDQASGLAANTFRTVLEAKGYAVTQDAVVDYGYLLSRTSVGGKSLKRKSA